MKISDFYDYLQLNYSTKKGKNRYCVKYFRVSLVMETIEEKKIYI